VTAIDTDPLAPAVEPILRGREDNFEARCGATGRPRCDDPAAPSAETPVRPPE